MSETQYAVKGRLSARSLLGKILAQQVERIQQCKAGAIEGTDPESVHDLRVAVRRVRVALKLSRDIIGRDVAPLRDQLGSVGKIAGSVRDRDVFAERLSVSLQRLSVAMPASDLLLSSMAARRAQAHGALSDVLSSRTYENVLDQMDSLLSDERSIQEVIISRRRIRRIGQKACSKKLARVLRWQRKNIRRLSDEDLHQLRREVKELRYTVEFFAEFLSTRSRRCLRITAVLQDCLGLTHDFVVAIQMLWELSKAVSNGPVSDGDLPLVVDSLDRLWRNDAMQVRERVFEVWEKSRKRLTKLQRTFAKV